jgi:hypothetical protein
LLLIVVQTVPLVLKARGLDVLRKRLSRAGLLLANRIALSALGQPHRKFEHLLIALNITNRIFHKLTRVRVKETFFANSLWIERLLTILVHRATKDRHTLIA